MVIRLNQRLLALGLIMVAFWPIVPWYVRRVTPVSERICGALALLTALGFLFRERRTEISEPPDLAVPTILVLVYAACIPFLPDLATAIVAMIAVAAVLSSLQLAVPLHLGLSGLLLLSLPVISRLQFYFGYPLRVVVGALAAPMIRMSGFSVVREGAVLSTGGELIVIDAPCSGVKMLWVGMFLTLTLCWLGRLSALRTAAALVAAVIAVVIGNVLRASSLFLLEAGAWDAPAGMHDAVGVTAFGITAIAILIAVRLIGRTAECVK